MCFCDTGACKREARRGGDTAWGRCAVWAGLAAAIVSIGCSDPQGGTDVGNGATVALELAAYDEALAARGITLSDGATIDGLWMVVDRIRLRPGNACSGGDDEVNVEGPLIADLLGGGIYGGPASFAVPPGPFCRLRLRFHKLESTAPRGAPAELAGRSILMRGARADGAPFTVASDLGDELELEAKDGSFALGVGVSSLVVAYGLGSWMAALDLASLPGGPALPIEVSDDVNAPRLAAFEDAVKASVKLFRDGDGDGALSLAERAPGSELAETP